MTEPLNPEKSRKLRPLRVILAILIAILAVLILERLPTSVKDREQNQSSAKTTETRETPEGAKYYYLNGFLDILENQTEERLKSLGVPEEEYKNLTEYLSKDEIFEIETKATLASELEGVYVELDDTGASELRKIFNLNPNYSFEKFKQLETAPTEYKILTELLENYHKTLNTVEDYDIQE